MGVKLSVDVTRGVYSGTLQPCMLLESYSWQKITHHMIQMKNVLAYLCEPMLPWPVFVDTPNLNETLLIQGRFVEFHQSWFS